MQKATSGGLSAYDLVLVITQMKAIDWGGLNIYYGDGFTFADFGGRCADTSFQDKSGGDTKTGYWSPGGSSGGSSGGTSSSSGASGSTGVPCAFCNGGRKDCDTCDRTGYEKHYVSGGGYDGVRPGTWELTTCSNCHGKGWTECHVCRGRSWIGG